MAADRRGGQCATVGQAGGGGTKARVMIYRLWRISDDKIFEDIEARDGGHALAIFQEKFGLKLTSIRGQAAPEYMMGHIKKDVNWTPTPNIPLWEEREPST